MLDQAIEALLFASDEPLDLGALSRCLGVSRDEVQTGVARLRTRLKEASGLTLREVAGGLRLETAPDHHGVIQQMFAEKKAQRLSMAALETLAMIAYRQPITGVEIAEMRGVASVSSILKNLLEKKLVRMAGRKKVIGRPMMYGTTREFLIQFGLNSIKDLPSLEEFRAAHAPESDGDDEGDEHDLEGPAEPGKESKT